MACASGPEFGDSHRADYHRGQPSYKVGAAYQINGVWYRPRVDYNYDETGLASWYGEAFDGQATANGEIYDLNALTAAHKTLPFGTLVKVTNLKNSKVVTVRINDRGPAAKGRLIDVSPRAAEMLDMRPQRLAKVRIEVIEGAPRRAS